MSAKKKENKAIRRRLASSWISTVISISLVLVLVGLASLVLLNAKAVSDYFKENVQVSVIMKTDAQEADVLAYQKELDALPYVRSSRYISREEGIREMSAMLGEDFMEAFQTAPIPLSIDLNLVAEYVSPDSLAIVRKEVGKASIVDEIIYQESLVEGLNANLGKITLVALVLIALLLFISVVLIGNTVRLSVFSKRFSVHTMRLVGATKGFIRRPFLRQAALQGTVAALLAIGILAGGLYLASREFGPLWEIFPRNVLLLTGGIVLGSGIILCVASTFIMAGRLVDMKKEELYS